MLIRVNDISDDVFIYKSIKRDEVSNTKAIEESQKTASFFSFDYSPLDIDQRFPMRLRMKSMMINCMEHPSLRHVCVCGV